MPVEASTGSHHLWADGLTFAYGSEVLFSGLDLRVQAGEIVRISGSNGVGKSTLMAVLAGGLRPSGGAVRYGPQVMQSGGGWRNGIGYMSAEFAGPTTLSGWDYLRLVATLRDRRPQNHTRVIMDLIGALGLTPRMDLRVDQFSSGMLKKLSFVASIAHTPALMLLDEPFETVDARSVEHMVQHLADTTRSRGCSVVYVSHRAQTGLADDTVLELGRRVSADGTHPHVR